MDEQKVSICVIVGVVTFIYLSWKDYNVEDQKRKDVFKWFDSIGFRNHGDQLYNSGLQSLLLCSSLAIAGIPHSERLEPLPVKTSSQLSSSIGKFLTESELRLFSTSANNLYEQLVLEYYLVDNGYTGYFTRLKSHSVNSLNDFVAKESNSDLHFFKRVFDQKFYEKIKGLQNIANHDSNSVEFATFKNELWTRRFMAEMEAEWSIGSMVVLSAFVATVVGVLVMSRSSFLLSPGSALSSRSAADVAAAAKRSFFQYVTGKYLVPQNCKIFFDWADHHPVGSTMSFVVKFFQRNGKPYPICDTDNFLVEIFTTADQSASHTLLRSKIATAVAIGGTEPSETNTARVKFTVRRSGTYRISVMIGNAHVNGSPFLKTFMPGKPDPYKTSIVHQCSTVVCTAGLAHTLVVEPRDEYGNLCKFTDDVEPTKGYEINVFEQITNEDSVQTNHELRYMVQTQRLHLQLRMDKEGCYHCNVRFQGVLLKNGDFNIIVLNANDAGLIQKNIAKKNHNVCYEAKLLAYNGERLGKPKKVYCYLSPKQFTIKEYMLRLIPIRLVTFRLCPSTKFQFGSSNKCVLSPDGSVNDLRDLPSPVLTIDDGCQPRVELVSKDRSIIAATFTQLLLKNIGGSETFRDKQDFFYHEVRKWHHKRFHDKLLIKVQRDSLLKTSLTATKSFSVNDWCKNFEVSFVGEQGLDWGGLRREWFELVCSELFGSKGHLFTSFKDDKQSLMHPNPNRPAEYRNAAKYYNFAGRIVGKCLYESALGGSYRQMVRARFTRSFLAQLIGLRVSYKYFEHDDPDLYTNKVKYILENDVTDMELCFAEDVYANGQLVKTVELIPNGAYIEVTNENKVAYLDSLAQYKLAGSVREEVDAFLNGLNDLIPDQLLSIFDENELEVLDWFWTAVSNFTDEEMARLLQFTTGCSQLPPNGFSDLVPRFQISPAPTFGNLPTAHTCFNQLCLPDYESYEHFEKSLLLAINEGSEGFGMV